MFQRLLLVLMLGVLAKAEMYSQVFCPTVTQPMISAANVCPGDPVTLTVSPGNFLVPSPAQVVEWHVSRNPNYVPGPSTFLGTADILGAFPTPCSPGPSLLGVLFNACNGPVNPTNGSEENEVVIFWSGSGFDASNLGIKWNESPGNGVGNATTSNLGTLGSCPLTPFPSGVVLGGCAIPGGPTTIVPPNAFVVVYSSLLADITLDYSSLCGQGYPVYVFQNSCTRLFGSTVTGAYSDGGPSPTHGPYGASFGCGLPVPITYGGASNTGNTQSYWSVRSASGAFVSQVVGCSSIPPISPPPPTLIQVTVAPYTYITTANDCGVHYFKAKVGGPLIPPTCPNPPATTAVTLNVECPVVSLAGSQTICQGANLVPITANVSGYTGTYRIEYTINGVAQTALTGSTTTNPVIPFTQTGPGVYNIVITEVRGSRCVGTSIGMYTVTINAPTPVALQPISICASQQPFNLATVLPMNVIGGVWSGIGVQSGSIFDNGPSASGPYLLLFTPAMGPNCLGPAAVTLTVSPPQAIVLSAPILPLCAGGTLNLTTLLPGGSPAGSFTLTGAAAGTSISGNILTVSANQVPSVTVNFTPSPGSGCFANATISIAVQAAQPISLTSPAPLCAGASLNLNTLLPGGSPAGAWSGSPSVLQLPSTVQIPNSGAATSYSFTFTPSTGCFSPGMVTVQVAASQPLVINPPSLCGTDLPYDLRVLEPAGATGGAWGGTFVQNQRTFDPGIGASGNYNVTYTPPASAGACLQPATVTLTVVPQNSVSFQALGAVCPGATVNLNTYLPSGAPAGSWSGPVGIFQAPAQLNIPSSGAASSYTVTYTTSGACPTNSPLTISVQPAPTITFNPSSPICASNLPYDLRQLEPSGFQGGFWSGLGVTGTNFSPAGGIAGPYVVNYVSPASGGNCAASGQTTLTVAAPTTLTIPTVTPVCPGQTLDLLNLLPGNVPAGTWSGPPSVFTAPGTFRAPTMGGSPSYLLTYTVTNSSLCVAPVQVTIPIGSGVPTSLLTTGPLCPSDLPFDLRTLVPAGAQGGVWVGTGVTGNIFDPAGATPGPYSLAYTPPTSAGNCSVPALVTLTLQPGLSVTLLTASPLCPGATFILTTLLPSGSLAGTWSGPAGVFQSPSTVNVPSSGAASFYDFTFTPSGSCAISSNTRLTIGTSTPLTLVAPPAICTQLLPYSLTQLEPAGFGGGVWSGPGVTGSTLDPAGAQPGTYPVTYSPPTTAGSCVGQGQVSLRVVPATAVVLSPAPDRCPGESIDLATLLPAGAPTGGVWSAMPTLPITGNTATLPGGTNAGVIVLTYTPPTGTCASAGTTSLLVTPLRPLNLQTPSPLCVGESLNLNTLFIGTPVTGQWSGSGVNTSTGIFTASVNGMPSVTFTPAAGTCSATASVLLTVSSSAQVTLSTAAICANSGLFELSTLLPNAAPNGSWSGTQVSGSDLNTAGLGAGTVQVTYSPTGCYQPSSVTLTVQSGGRPSLMAAPTMCTSQTNFNLSTLQDPAYPNGVWTGPAGAVTASIFDASVVGPGSYPLTFTPTSTCLTSATIVVQVLPQGVPNIAAQSTCAGPGTFNLRLIEDSAFVGGTWSGSPSVTGTQLDLSSPGNLTLVYTPVAGSCARAISLSFIISPARSLQPQNSSVCATGSPIILSSLDDPTAPGGTWTLNGQALTSFNPSGRPAGPYTLTYTLAGNCFTPGTSVITVTSGTQVQLLPGNVCEFISSYRLDNLLPSATAGTWSGNFVAGNDFNVQLSGVGSFSVMFTPSEVCGLPSTTTLRVEIATSVGLATGLVCLAELPLNLRDLEVSPHTGGNWSGPNVVNNVYNPSTPAAGLFNFTYNPLNATALCLAPNTTSVTVANGQAIALADAIVCAGGSVDLLTLLPAGTPAGAWLSVPGLVGNTYTPPLGTTTQVLTYSPTAAGSCVGDGTSTITVQPSAVNIPFAALQLCTTDAPLALNAVNTGGFSGGVWRNAAGDVVQTFDPAQFAAGTYPLTYTGGAADCSPAGVLTVRVVDAETPTLTQGTVCQTNANFDLGSLLDPNFQNGVWLLNGTVVSQLVPRDFPVGTLTLAFQSSEPCVARATTSLVLTPAAPIALASGQRFCANSGRQSLAFLLPAGVNGGTWSGEATLDGFFETDGRAPGAYPVTYNLSVGCFLPNSVDVVVDAGGVATLRDTTVCANGASFDLGLIGDRQIRSGVFTNASGSVVTAFDPNASGPGSYTITYTPTATCFLPAIATITVSTAVSPVLSNQTVCANSGPVNLRDWEDPNFPGGRWTGIGVSRDTIFSPGAAGAVTLTYLAPTGTCAQPTPLTVRVGALGTPVLRGQPLCVGNAPVLLSAFGDPNFPMGSWTGRGITGALFNPALAGPGPVALTFTPTGGCAQPSILNLVVQAGGMPILQEGDLCSNAPDYDLSVLLADPALPGRWSGDGVDPVAGTFSAANLGSGTYSLTFTPAGDCGEPATTTLRVGESVAPTITSVSLCQGISAVAISDLLPQNLLLGSWSGLVQVGDSLSLRGLIPGDYLVIFTPDSAVHPCAVPAVGQVTLQPGGQPAIANRQLCSTSPAFALSSLEPAGYRGGSWTVDGTAAQDFDPGLRANGTYTLRYAPVGACNQAVSLTLEVVDAVTAVLPNASLCANAGPVALKDFEPTAAPNGTWMASDGTVVTTVDPGLIGIGVYSYIYQAPAASCLTNAPTLQLEITPLVVVSFGIDTVCVADGAVELADALVPSGIPGTWSGNGVRPDGRFTPSILSGPTTLRFVPTGTCTDAPSYTYDLVAVGALGAGTPSFSCSPTDGTYTATVDLTFSPTNGPILSSLGSLSGSILTIAGLFSGMPQAVQISDAAACTPDLMLNLSFTCSSGACTTEPGTLGPGPLKACQGETISFATAIGTTLDPDDVLLYVLDDDELPANGVLAKATVPSFTEPAGANGRLLYLYAYAGNDDGSGGVDLADACAKTSPSIRVRWVTPVIATSVNAVCEPDNLNFRVSVMLAGGERPYQSTGTTGGRFSPDGATFLSDAIPSGQAADIRIESTGGVCPALVLTTTRDCAVACVRPNPGTFTGPLPALCGGGLSSAGYNNDARLGSGDRQFFIVYADPGLSTVLLRATTLPIDFSQFGENTTVYLTSYAGTADSNGGINATCASESAVQAVRISAAVTLRLDTIVCPPLAFTRFGVVFDENNSTATIPLRGIGGACDTTLTVSVTFTNGGNQFVRTDTLCAGVSIVIGGRTFTAASPMDNFSVGTGACQDDYQVDLTFLPAVTSRIDSTLCQGDSLVVGNRVFSALTPSGSATLTGRNGCDSVVTVTVRFESPPVIRLVGDPNLCNPEALNVRIEVDGSRDVTALLSLNGGAGSRINLQPGINNLSYPALGNNPRLRLDSLRATTGSCVLPIARSLGYTPIVSRLSAQINEPLAGGYRSCAGSTVESIGVIPSSGVGPYRYQWSRGDTTQSIANVELGTYEVVVTDALGCVSMSEVSVGEADSLDFTATTQDPSCAGGLGSVSISLEEMPTGLRYRFDLPGLKDVTAPDLSFDSLRAGRYVFQLVQANGCDQSTFLTIVDPEVENLIKRDSIEVRLGDSVELRVRINSGDMVRWTPGEILSCDTCALTFAGPITDTEVNVAVTDVQGCVTLDRVFLVLLPTVEIFIPTAFSPNGDGVNDQLLPLTGPEVARILGFQVFDRWGEVLHQRFDFAANDERAAWDGTYRGREMDPAVFVVLTEVELVNGERRTVTGDVTLLR